MPSITHDAPVEVLRRNPLLAIALLHGVSGITLPDKVAATLGSTDLTAVIPAQFLADMVIVVSSQPDGKPILAVVVESQLRSDDDKEFSWPAYVTTARKLYRCDAALLVICPDSAYSEACRRTIHIGHPEFALTPIVVDTSSTPDPQDPGLPPVGPELTVFAACMGTLDLEDATAQHQVLDAVRGVDTEKRRAYLTLILAVASDATRHALEAMMATPAYKSDFIEGFVEQGIAQGVEQGIEQGIQQGIQQGKVQGKAEDLLKVLAARGIQLSRKQQDRVKSCRDFGQLDRWFDRALTVGTADEVFGS